MREQKRQATIEANRAGMISGESEVLPGAHSLKSALVTAEKFR
jgi:hypothetical protein